MLLLLVVALIAAVRPTVGDAPFELVLGLPLQRLDVLFEIADLLPQSEVLSEEPLVARRVGSLCWAPLGGDAFGHPLTTELTVSMI